MSRVFKKRPRGFNGTPRQFMPSSSSPGPSSISADTDEATTGESVAEVHVERPIPVETASSKKLAISLSVCPSSPPSRDLRNASQPSTSSAGEPSVVYEEKLKGYRLVNCERFSQAVSQIGLCSVCKSPLTLKEDLVSRRGLVSKLMISCTNTACKNEALVSDPYSSDKESKALNMRSVMGMREIGRGMAGLQNFCGIMDMLPPVTVKAFRDLNETLSKASREAVTENMKAASAHLHWLRGVDPGSVLDIAVTCDGTWSKRGYTATHGVVVVIEWETGQVLDFEILTKRCTACSLRKARCGEGSPEFAEWYEGHKSSCQKNHDGSSPAMECEGAVRIWKRSESNLHLRFTEIISDGNAKTIVALNVG